MTKIKTTSYCSDRLKDIFRTAVWVCNPNVAVEIGIQQGHSAGMIGAQMRVGAHLSIYDSFRTNYTSGPKRLTHANATIADSYLRSLDLKCNWNIFQEEAEDVSVFHSGVGLLHIDIGNHYDNMGPLLAQWIPKVTGIIILEGGNYNHWQRRHGYRPFTELIHDSFVRKQFDASVTAEGTYAITILRRR